MESGELQGSSASISVSITSLFSVIFPPQVSEAGNVFVNFRVKASGSGMAATSPNPGSGSRLSHSPPEEVAFGSSQSDSDDTTLHRQSRYWRKHFVNLNFFIMKKLEYKTVIAASAKKVWDTMIRQETYRQWVAKSWPNSFYEGNWKKGEEIRFIGPDGSGTLAELIEVKPHERILARHIAVLGPKGEQDRTSEMAKGWIGSTEEYLFSEQNGKTTLTVVIQTTEEWVKMFDDGWPAALEELKNITERQLTVA
jgi:uncharacterized protein YndB with AHSA1/START domain